MDLDHIQPKAEFGFHFNTKDMFEDEKSHQKSFHDGRGLLGNSIGNYRWVSSSVNRSDGDCPIREKLALDDAGPPAPPRPSLADCRIDPASRDLWKRASGPPDGRWTEDRIKAWQQAVEERAVRLYEEFWRKADFGAWFGVTASPDRVHPSSGVA